MNKILGSLLIVIFVFTQCLFAQNSTEINYMVPGQLLELQQPKDMDCWITVATIMLSWKYQRALTIEQTVKAVGSPWDIFYETNTGLTYDDQDKFAQAIGLKGEPPANYILEAYIEMLQKHGPLWINTGNGFRAHARVLVGVEWDGTYEGSKCIFIDPAKGKKIVQNALAFVLEFEEEAIAFNEDGYDFRIQIYHF